MPCLVAHLKVSFESEHHPRAEFFGAGVTGCWWGRSVLGRGDLPRAIGRWGCWGTFSVGKVCGVKADLPRFCRRVGRCLKSAGEWMCLGGRWGGGGVPWCF